MSGAEAYRTKVTVPLPWAAQDVHGFSTSVIWFPNDYVLIAWPAGDFFRTLVEETPHGRSINRLAAEDDVAIESVRTTLAARVGLPVSPTVPKVGLVASADEHGVDLLFRTRMSPEDGWHPGAPGSGLQALGVAAMLEGSVVDGLLPSTSTTRWSVLTPAGLREVALRPGPTGALGLQITIEVEFE